MKTIVISLAFLMPCVCRAQQDPLYSQYINNPFVINPAYAGFSQNLNATVNYRLQWSGLEGSPKTVNANGHISLFDNRMGAGLMFVSDQIGNNTTNEIQGSYAYRIDIDNSKTLSFGLQAGIINYKSDNSKVTPYDSGDPLFEGTLQQTKPNFGGGIIFSTDYLFLGLSVPRLMKSSVSEQELTTDLHTQHFYAMGSCLFFLTDRVRLKPSTLVKMVKGSTPSVDLNASLILYEKYQVGMLTRNFNTYGITLLAWFKESLQIGYVFEVPTGNSVGTNFTTHEITIGFRSNVFTFHRGSAAMSF